MTRAEIARAIPAGSRRARSQRKAERAGKACPDLEGVRPKFREHLEAWWVIHCHAASWGGPGRPPAGITSPGRKDTCQRGHMSVSTYKRCRAWWEKRGYIAIVRPGWTPALRAASLVDEDDHNTSQAYVLCVPRPAEKPERARPADPARRQTGPLPHSSQEWGSLHAREGSKTTSQQSSSKPGKQGAPRSRWLRTGTLASLTDGWWAHLTAPFARWTAADVLYAVDFRPDGRQHRTRAANVKYPVGWLRWRLSHWLNPDGTAKPSKSERRAAAAEAHRAYLARQAVEPGVAAARARWAAVYGNDHETAVPAPQRPWTSVPRTRRAEPVLGGWAARRTTPRPAPAIQPSARPEWWTEAVAAAAAAVAAEEAAARGGAA